MWEITEVDVDRSRIGWWVVVLSLGAAFAYVIYSFIGTFVLGVFLYYAARPVYERVRGHIDSDEIAAAVTILGIIVPILLLIVYAGFSLSQDLLVTVNQETLRSVVNRLASVDSIPDTRWETYTMLIEQPLEAVRGRGGELRDLVSTVANVGGIIANGLLHIALALTLAFYLLRDGDRIRTVFRRIVGSSDTAIYSYMTAVDRDLQTIFFGNVLFVLAVAVLAAIIYQGANFLAPPALQIPIPLVLAALTGVTALIPIVVSKVVYVPLVLYLAYQASLSGVSMVIPAGLLVVSFVFLDILPQAFLQPYITGRKLKLGLLLFAYIFGPLLFGWYGLFFLPLLLVLGIQALRIVVVELIHGEPVTSAVDVEESLGSDPATGIDGDSETGGPVSDGSDNDGDETPSDPG